MFFEAVRNQKRYGIKRRTEIDHAISRYAASATSIAVEYWKTRWE